MPIMCKARWIYTDICRHKTYLRKAYMEKMCKWKLIPMAITTTNTMVTIACMLLYRHGNVQCIHTCMHTIHRNSISWVVGYVVDIYVHFENIPPQLCDGYRRQSALMSTNQYTRIQRRVLRVVQTEALIHSLHWVCFETVIKCCYTHINKQTIISAYIHLCEHTQTETSVWCQQYG